MFGVVWGGLGWVQGGCEMGLVGLKWKVTGGAQEKITFLIGWSMSEGSFLSAAVLFAARMHACMLVL